MKRNQNLMRLGSRIKLLRRHIQEWNGLLIHQKQVRFLITENFKPHIESPADNSKAIIQQITNRGIHLAQVMARQTEERQQMSARHQREGIELEQAIDSHKSN